MGNAHAGGKASVEKNNTVVVVVVQLRKELCRLLYSYNVKRGCVTLSTAPSDGRAQIIISLSVTCSGSIGSKIV
jgi:hypothetical protein